MTPAQAKRRLRAALRERVLAMSPGERAAASEVIRGHLEASAWWRDASVVMVYAGDGTEPDLDGLIDSGTAAGKTVCVPRVDWDGARMEPAAVASAAHLVSGRHGIRVPPAGAAAVDPARLGLVVAPGVGFDRDGGRVGRGGGFYDRFLAERSMGCVVVGVCFVAQVVDRVPGEAHDRRVDGLVTEAGPVVTGVREDVE